jgi:hypothetical protein
VRALIFAGVLTATLAWPAAGVAAGWETPVGVNVVAGEVIAGGGYPDPPGATKPEPGTCRPGLYNSNRSESWIAVRPGTDALVGVSKLFFENFSTFYNFNLGAYAITGGAVTGASQVQGYDCVSTGTQAMPPSWTNNTDPNVAWDLLGRVYQTTLPFNAFWGGSTLHPDGAIDVSYSDDMGQHWVKGNGGQDLEQSRTPRPGRPATSTSSGSRSTTSPAVLTRTTSTRCGRCSIPRPRRSGSPSRATGARPFPSR